MPKERSFNPAQQQRKADRQKEIAKSKKQLQNQRNEKLARRNPDRLQKQIDELKELEQRGSLRQKDKDTLQQLERDLKGVKRARDALGDAAPKFASRDRTHDGSSNARQEQAQRRQQHQQHLGKRRRDEEDAHSSDTDPEVRDIPMPRDTPPPIPRQQRERFKDPQIGPDGKRIPHALPTKPGAAATSSKTVYSAAPQIRDLKKEAVKFMPSVVAAQKKRVQGEGKLLEPEEIDRLEKAGYYAAQKAAEEASNETTFKEAEAVARAIEREDVDLDEETRRFEEELANMEAEESMQLPKSVQMEDVEDEGD